MKITPRKLGLPTLWGFALILGACGQPGPEQALDDYLARLARTVDLPLPEVVLATLPRPPKTSDLHLQLPSGGLDTLDFLSLTGCAVQITIGKRNSSLGIFATDSQRLLLELEYLELAPDCIRHLNREGKTKLAGLLSDAFELKRAQLPGLIFNATLASSEFRAFWSKPPVLGDYPGQTNSAVLSALGAIHGQATRWLAGDYRADNKAFEILLSEVAAGDGGALLAALAVQESRLAAANKLLHQRLARGPLCAGNYRSKAAAVLPVVVEKYFISAVQPWSAALGHRYYELVPALRQLEELLGNFATDSFHGWKFTRDKRFSQLFGAPANHVELLKQVLEPCRSG